MLPLVTVTSDVIPAFTPLCFPGSKYISKSEDNLLTPHCDTSWRGASPVGAHSRGSFIDTPLNTCLKSSYTSEPAIMASKPPAAASLPKKLCCASSADSLESSITEAQSQTGLTLLKIKTAFTESENNLLDVIQNTSRRNTTKTSDGIVVPPQETPADRVLSVDTSTCPAEQRFLASDQNIIFGQTEIAAFSPLHIDSVVFESGVYCSPPTKAEKGSRCAAVSSHNSSMGTDGEREVEQVNCSRLIDALDIQSPALFKLGISGLQSTPYKLVVEHCEELVVPPKINSVVSVTHEKSETYPEMSSQVQNQQPVPPCSQETEKCRVAEHIQHFNMLTLHSPRGSRAAQLRSPLKFQRTPVRQTIRRINSLLGDSRRPSRHTASQSSQVVKAVSLESGLSPHPQRQPHQSEARAELSNSVCPIKKPPPVPPKKPSTLAWKSKASALGDRTNKVQPKSRVDSSVSDPAGTHKPPALQLVEKDRTHYRGSPRNPLNQGRLLSATKPVDL